MDSSERMHFIHTPNLALIGINHKTTPVEVRERLAFGAERIPAALTRFNNLLESSAENRQDCTCNEVAPIEAALLSTCNRTEIYVIATDLCSAQAQAMSYLAEYAHMPVSELENIAYVHCGLEAAHHLLRVAAGLDSLVLGENEILGQVKQAFEIAQLAGTSGALLSALFRYAVQAGKRVRSETDIGHTSLSVATIVVELAEEMFGSLSDRTALLIGAGKISSITGRALVNAGLHCVLVANRTYDKAQKLAQNLGGKRRAYAIHFDALVEHLAQADIVICSTGAPHTVLHKETVEEAMCTRPERPLLIADLAVPRDADPEAGKLINVRLADIDDLQQLVISRHPMTASARQQAEAIVEDELQAFYAWYTARRSAPLIRALRAKAEAICQEQIDLTMRRLGGLNLEQQRAIQQMAQSIVNKLLHDPISYIKAPPDVLTSLDALPPPNEVSATDHTAWVKSLFGLN